MEPMGSEVEKGIGGYFLKDATIELGKLGYDHDKINSLTEKAQKAVKENPIKDSPYKRVHWSDTFKVDQEGVMKTMKENHENLLLGLGGEEKAKEIVEEISELAEGWEAVQSSDSYGDLYVSIPLDEVYDALLEIQSYWINECGEINRRLELALNMISFYQDYYTRRYDDGRTECVAGCVVYGS
jgi:hypothetical protein